MTGLLCCSPASVVAYSSNRVALSQNIIGVHSMHLELWRTNIYHRPRSLDYIWSSYCSLITATRIYERTAIT